MTQCYDSLSSNHTNPPISSMLTTSMSIFTLADTEPSAGNIFVTGHLGASCLPPRRTSENVRLLKRLKEEGDELDSMDAHVVIELYPYWSSKSRACSAISHVPGILCSGRGTSFQ